GGEVWVGGVAGGEVRDRRGGEGRLRESEEREPLAAEGTGDGMWDWDLRTDRVVFSSRWKAMIGCEDAAVGEHAGEWLTRVHVEDVAQLKADIAAHVEGRSQRLGAGYRPQLGDGSYRWMLARGLAVRGADGRGTRMAGTQTDISARKAAEELLVHQALHDALTGLPNRVAFVERLERSIRRAVRGPGYRFAVLFLDIDRFKLVNDSLGHVSGDQLLIAFAKRLLACLRPGDMVAHMGSDEFAILADHIHQPADATQIAQRIQRELSEPFNLDEQEVFAAASIGIALSTAVYQRPEELLRDADSAMYRAKAGGTGRYELFDRAMQQRALFRLQLETDLRRAIERRELRVHYQPIVSLDNGAVSGFEALVRWQHPERGLIGAADFVPVAEETGLIVP